MSARLGLGTVQFGLDYGIARSGDRPSDADISEILSAAVSDGCAMIDTAAAYGDSEAALGRAMPAGFETPIVTKCPVPPGGVSPEDAYRFVMESFRASIARLGRKTIWGYLAHDAKLVTGPCGEGARRAFRELRDAGTVRKVGVSLYDSEEISEVLAVFDPEIVQLPVSILDQRLVKGGELRRLRERGVEVHARSALLQGVIGLDPSALPSRLMPLAPRLELLRKRARAAGSNPIATALRFLRGCLDIDVVIIGVQTIAQWTECARAFRDGPIVDTTDLACDDPNLIDPRRWSGS